MSHNCLYETMKKCRVLFDLHKNSQSLFLKILKDTLYVRKHIFQNKENYSRSFNNLSN